MWPWLTGITLGIVVLAAVLMTLGAAARRRRRYDSAVRLWMETAPERRRKAFEDRIQGPAIDAAAWYLLGCAYLQEGRPRLAARAFGVAHHADYTLETAAMLTFACLKASDGPDSDIVEQMIRTWHEMREPNLLHREEDRLMVECLASTTAPPALSPLGRLIWLTVSPDQQGKIQKMLTNGSADAKALRLPAPSNA